MCALILEFSLWGQQTKCRYWNPFDFQFGVKLEIAIVTLLAWLHFSFVCNCLFSTGSNTWYLHLHSVHFAEFSPFKLPLQSSALFEWFLCKPNFSFPQRCTRNAKVSSNLHKTKWNMSVRVTSECCWKIVWIKINSMHFHSVATIKMERERQWLLHGY